MTACKITHKEIGELTLRLEVNEVTPSTGRGTLDSSFWAGMIRDESMVATSSC